VRKKSAIKFGLWWNLLNKTGQNSFLPYFPYNPRAKLRLEVLFKKFHPRIDRTTLYSTKSYLLNTIKPFLGHENRSWQNLKNKGGTLWNLNYKILSILFLDTKILDKSAVRFVLGWNSLMKIFIFPFWFWVGICMGGTLKTQSFVISSTKLSFKYKLAQQKCHQFCSLVEFVEQNWTK
jgi:hypothetical protein